jgi:predicted nucleotidyltransferase
MQFTSDADIGELLQSLPTRIESILSTRLVGVYLYGSLVTGDFERGSSDIDLLVVTSADIDDGEFARLDAMHGEVSSQYREWEGRIEIAYASSEALKTYRTRASRIAVISPGEPFHFKEAGKDWLMNWYVVREKGVALFGLPPQDVIDPITRDEFVEAVRENTRDWGAWLRHMTGRKGQAYAILTMCRALHLIKTGEQASKRAAAMWASKALPEWSSLIENALLWREVWRSDEGVDHAATFPETERFVNFMIGQIVDG